MLTIDWETVDPYISLGYGSGWVFALRGYRNPEFRLLGASVKVDNQDTRYITNMDELRSLIREHQIFCMHNAQYDIGCTLYLFALNNEVWDIKNLMFYDTMLMGKLVTQDLFSYSLSSLSNKYGGAVKEGETLTDYLWSSGLYQKLYKEKTGRNKHVRPSEDVLFEMAINNMHQIPDEIVGQYCNADVNATYDLYNIFKRELAKFPKEFDYVTYSTLIKACIQMKIQGIRVDIDQAVATRDYLEDRAEELSRELYSLAGREFNINSSSQVVEVMKSLGLSSFGVTATGNESANKDWLEHQAHPACKLIIKIKNYQKLARDFLTKIIDYQQIHRQNNNTDNRIFWNLNIFGAVKTGRFSSSGSSKKKGYELNMQQIPKRGEDSEADRYVRAVFLPDEGDTWVGADYSNQEQRLQVSDACKFGCEGAEELRKILVDSPESDFHQVVANMCGIGRTPAKTVNLGLTYGMGGAKLCHSLGLPTEFVITRSGRRVEVPGKEGKKLLDKYHKFLPFMRQLQDYVNGAIKEYGYIKTLAGRKLYLDKAIKIDGEWVSFERKGLNKRIQGSAADITIAALLNCYNAGLKMLVTVHDEINISSSNVEKDVSTLRECMSNTLPVSVPMLVDISTGNSWAD